MVDPNVLKSLKKDLKEFQKLAKKDTSKAKLKGIELKKKINGLLVDPEIINNIKFTSKLKEVLEVTDLFISNIDQIEKIKGKYKHE